MPKKHPIKHYRDMALIERDIRGAKEWLAGLIDERMRAERAARMRLQRQSPEFIAKMKAGYAAAQLDPEWRAMLTEKKRKAAIISNRDRALPPMSKRERAHYDKVRRSGVARHIAIDEALRLEVST